jgi:hypothetical protein
MRALALPEALRRFGLTVELVPGWERRGSDSFNPGGSVGHHTAGSSRGTRPSLGICVNGRSDLPPPLCNTFTDRNGVAIVVASGRANHAGRGGFRGLVGNSSVFGHEAEDEGDGLWTPAQRWAFPRVHAAHLWLIGRDASWYCSHRTWTPRKPDPAGLADVDVQREIHALLTGAHTPVLEEEPVLKLNDAGPAVAFYQECLKAEANRPGHPLRDWGRDQPINGRYERHMELAVDQFQRGWALQRTGKIDGLTAATLAAFAPDVATR